MKITRDTVMFEILTAHPEALKIFEKYGMSCSGCMKVMKENLEEAARKHGADLEALLEELENVEKVKTT